MKALYLSDGVSLRDVSDPEPARGEVLLRVLLAGICNTDLELSRGYMGFRGIPGHEFVAKVEALGEGVESAWLGARVVGEINVGCNACTRCAQELSRHCAQRTVLGILGKDGALAERLTLPVRNLHRVPDALSDENAVFAEPLAAAFEVLEQLRVQPDARVLVLGDGKLGLLTAQVLRGTGCALSLAGRHQRKLALAESYGARVHHANETLPGDWDLVVEATGSPEGLARALTLVRPRGTLVLKSTFHGAPQVDTARIVIDELTIVGSRCGPFAPALRSLAAKRADPSAMLDASYPLSDGVEAFAHAQRAGVLKVLVRP